MSDSPSALGRVWGLIRQLFVMLWRLLAFIGSAIGFLFKLVGLARSAASGGGTGESPKGKGAQASSDEGPVVLDKSPEEILEAIMKWDRADALDVCENLNAYDHLIVSGAEVPSLDLRHVPSEDPSPYFRFGAPNHYVALDRKGLCVVRSGAPRAVRRYGVAPADRVARN